MEEKKDIITPQENVSEPPMYVPKTLFELRLYALKLAMQSEDAYNWIDMATEIYNFLSEDFPDD